MGTTLTALQDAAGFRGNFALCVEGLEYLLTDSSDTAGLLTAWSGTGWSSALSGLAVQGELVSEWNPFADDIAASGIQFLVRPDRDDTLAKILFATQKGTETRLTASLASSTSTMTVADTTDFSSSGTVYVGNERITYSGKTSTTFTGCTRGTLHPFKTSGGSAHRFSRVHDVLQGPRSPLEYPIVSTAPQSWVGKWVGLWIHRVVGSTWDTKAQAHLVFAGIIREVQDTEEGALIQCEDLLTTIARKSLFVKPYNARIREGIYVQTGERLNARESYKVSGSAAVENTAAELVVVSGSPSNASQIQAGWYTTEELVRRITDWLQYEYATTGDLDGKWTCSLDVPNEAAARLLRFIGDFTAGTYFESCTIEVRAPERWMNWLGFTKRVLKTDSYTSAQGAILGQTTAPRVFIFGDRAPMRLAVQQGTSMLPRIQCDAQDGTWFNNTAWLPKNLSAVIASSSRSYGFLRIGEQVFCCYQDGSDASVFHDVVAPSVLIGLMAKGASSKIAAAVKLADFPPGRTIDEPGDVWVTQVVILQGDLEDLLPRILGSTDGTGYNESTYDSLPSSLGVGIPWELLGTEFLTSLKRVDSAADSWTPTIVLEKPLRLSEVLAPELILRGAFPIFKEGTLRLAKASLPVVEASTPVLNEGNKGTPPATLGVSTESAYSDEYLINQVKVLFNRDADGQYSSVVDAVHPMSIRQYGTRSIEVKCNSVQGDGNSNDTIETLVQVLAKHLLPMFARPLQVIRRTIQPSLFFDLHPGDIVSFDDEFVRDPSTGARGVTNLPAMVRRLSFDVGSRDSDMVATIELMAWDGRRITLYAPTAETDETADSSGFTNGYNSGTNTLRCKAHAYSASTDAADASHFRAGDKIRVVSITPGSALASQASATVQSVSGNDIVLTGALSLAPLSNLPYRIVYDNFANAITSTQDDRCYQAGTDFKISGNLGAKTSPCAWGRAAAAGDQTSSTITDAAEVINEIDAGTGTDPLYYGDGYPVSAGVHTQLAKNLDNYLHYRAAIQASFHQHHADIVAVSMNLNSYVLMTHVLYVGGGIPIGRTIKLRVSPRVQVNTNAATVTLYVSRALPGYVRANSSLAAIAQSVTVPQPFISSTWSSVSATGAYQKLSAAEVDITSIVGAAGLVVITLVGTSSSGLTSTIRVSGYSELKVVMDA